jgi:hypothetical protein
VVSGGIVLNNIIILFYFINGKYRQEIRLAKSEGPLWACIMRQHIWTESQMDLIDWKALAQALNRTQYKEVALVKLLAKVTPTATRMNRYHGSTLPKRPPCHTNNKTIDHIIQCLSDECHKWRSALLTHLPLVCTTALHLCLTLAGGPTIGWASVLVSARASGMYCLPCFIASSHKPAVPRPDGHGMGNSTTTVSCRQWVPDTISFGLLLGGYCDLHYLDAIF